MELKEPTLEQIDKIREAGFRPDVVGCFVNERKILLLYRADYKLWLFPQGGIQNKETPHSALEREMSEEMGEDFYSRADKNFKYLGDDKMEFTPDKYNMDELKLDNGTPVNMIGKHYLFYVINMPDQEIAISKTEFNDYFWLEYRSAAFLTSKIYQSGRRRIMTRCLNLLKDKGIID